MVQGLYKKMTHGFKNPMRNLDNFRQTFESPKNLKFDGLLLTKKYILQPKHIKIILSYLCENSPNLLFIFHDTTPLYFFQLKYFILSLKVAHQSVNFKTHHFRGSNLPNSSYHFSNKKPFFQSLDYFSVPGGIILL